MRYTLITDGSSDRSLIPIIEWTLWQVGVRCDLRSSWADTRNLKVISNSFNGRIMTSLELFPCDLLFVHRDGENQGRPPRLAEISEAMNYCQNATPHVPIIPIRMHESWLLCDADAIRSAAGNPNGTISLDLPIIDQIENIPDPKERLFSLIKKASELKGRKLQRLNVEFARNLITNYMEDFSILRRLPSFAAFENDFNHVVETHHFNNWL